MKQRKGIILAGGSGSRLYPITLALSKQLLPLYDKPMIYYPISVLMLADIREIAIITTPHDQDQFQRLLGDGSQWGLSFSYIVQEAPNGLAEAYILAETFLAGHPSALILGDNIFYGDGLPELLTSVDGSVEGGTVFGYRVADPERYGVVGFDAAGRANSLVEKPASPLSNYAITGLYFLDNRASERAKTIAPSARGEIEITSLLELYLEEDSLTVKKLGRGYAWLDTGTHASLLDAGNFVRTLQDRQGLLVGSPDEVAYDKSWISSAQLKKVIEAFGKNSYGAFFSDKLWY
jgi:glucose-1-phosphate thymidylyltransferase